MRIFSVGSSPVGSKQGLTLLELLVAMSLAAMIMAISFPSVAGGLDGIRLQTSGRKVASFVNAARTRADLDQTAIEITIDRDQNRISALSTSGQWERTLEITDGLRISDVLPPPEGAGPPAMLRRFIVFPGVPPPRFKVELTTSRGRSLTVELNPLTGAPLISEVKQ